MISLRSLRIIAIYESCHRNPPEDEEKVHPSKLSSRAVRHEQALSSVCDRGPREARLWLLGVGIGPEGSSAALKASKNLGAENKRSKRIGLVNAYPFLR